MAASGVYQSTRIEILVKKMQIDDLYGRFEISRSKYTLIVSYVHYFETVYEWTPPKLPQTLILWKFGYNAKVYLFSFIANERRAEVRWY